MILAPKEECQCPSIDTCYDIIAARMSVGLECKSEKSYIQFDTTAKKIEGKGQIKMLAKRNHAQLTKWMNL